MKMITAIKLKEKIDNGEMIQIIDIRDTIDFEICHIAKSISIPKSEVMDNIDKIARDIPVVFYCKYGVKSPTSIKTLENEAGFTNLYSLQDGIYDWAKEVERSILNLI
ncbi:MAG: rhodanese-like domain-containing protein [Bacteroidetes bacterium]|nr:rhodanese-like domain-containing protein [Bacteroidota bacterium]